MYIHNISIHTLTFPFVCWAEANDCWCASAKVFESIQLSLSQSYKWPFKGAAFDPGVRKSVATKACLSGISELNRLLELSQIQTEFYYLSYSEHTGHSEISWNPLNFLSKILFSVLYLKSEFDGACTKLKAHWPLSNLLKSAICGVTVFSVALVSSFIGSSGISPSTRMFA